jgi:transposase InsO family protein
MHNQTDMQPTLVLLGFFGSKCVHKTELCGLPKNLCLVTNVLQASRIWRKTGVYPARKAHAKCVCRKPQRQVQKRMLNRHWFRTMAAAKVEVMQWQHQYNNVSPHSSLNYLPPVVFANKAA